MNGLILNNITDCYLGNTQVTALYLGSTKIWPHDYSSDYLTITALQDCYITYHQTAHGTQNTQYSLDGGTTWIAAGTVDIKTPLMHANESVIWKATPITVSSNGQGYFGANDANDVAAQPNAALFNASGNVLSLIYGDNFIGQTSAGAITGLRLSSLFENSPIVSSKNLILPENVSVTYEYAYMFSGCTSLIDTPVLQHTGVSDDCYYSMFEGCTALTTAPALPATTLGTHCYYRMFYGCTSLVTAPALPATTLGTHCYYRMFYGCTALTTAPELPATTLANYCYAEMFYGCTSLNYIKCLATNNTATGCTDSWVSNVASSGTFVKDSSMTSWPTGANGIPNDWTVSDYLT